MPISISDPQKLKSGLRARAEAEGFSASRFVDVASLVDRSADLSGYITAGFHGDMAWMAETFARRSSPRGLWPEARTAMVFAMNYGQGLDSFARLQNKSTGVIASYALNRDYHDLVKGKLKRLAQWFGGVSGHDVKVFVDTAPLMEKPLAAQAGVGWQGKHTNLVSRELGSWFFLGAMLTTATLPTDQPETDHCGSCRACLEICPTQAFPAPYHIDARRCISYLTIEHKGPIDPVFRKPMGNRIYGCDDCLAICPWNKFAEAAAEIKLHARKDLLAPELAELLTLDDAGFRALFAGSPVKRIGRDRFLRNVLIAAGNSGDADLVPAIKRHLADASPLVRGMAVWALAQLLVPAEFGEMKRQAVLSEFDPGVLTEWQSA
jgi:epoxyqueuosine reductase